MSSRSMKGRRGARRLALEALYAWEADGQVDPDGRGGLLDQEALDFARSLIEGVSGQVAELDRDLSQFCEGWAFERLGRVERNILRLALFEMRYRAQLPAIAINEAVDLAKEFGGERSGAFVNAVLMQVVRAERGSQE